MHPNQSFIRQDHLEDQPYYLFCIACRAEGVDCGPNRNKVSIKARTYGYRLVPGIGWVCNNCWYATSSQIQ